MKSVVRVVATSTNLLPTSMLAHRSIIASITAPPCGQAAGGDEGILFYGLRRSTSQVYVSRRRVRLPFGVKSPISRRPFCLWSTYRLFGMFGPAYAPNGSSDEDYVSGNKWLTLARSWVMRPDYRLFFTKACLHNPPPRRHQRPSGEPDHGERTAGIAMPSSRYCDLHEGFCMAL